MQRTENTRFVLAVFACVTFAAPASAHFKLMKPASWLKEDQTAVGGGGPQKGSPCGPGGYDDVQPIPISGVVTEFHAGETIEVDWVDTIAHPGHFRIALAANRADLKNPDIVQDASCNYDESMVPKTASGNVLADGVFFRSRVGFSDAAGKMFTTQVTLPNEPCDKCTLQVMQVMESDIKALSNCYYFHCADIRILPAGQSSGSGGTPGQEAGGASSGSGGASGAAGSLGMGGLLGLGGTGMGTGAIAGVPSTMVTGSGGLVGAGGGSPLPGLTGGGPAAPTGGVPGTSPGAPGIAGSAMSGMPAAIGAGPASSPNQNEGCSIGSTRRGNPGGRPIAVLLMLAMLVWTRRHRW